jgi:4-hydroxy-tetrahydrodipicolinate synthase
VLVVVPYYTRPSEPGLVEHFTEVADASPVPIVLYNVPHRTGLSLGASAVLDLSSHPRIVGLKQAVGALDLDTLRLLAEAGPDLRVLAGDDALITATVLMGGAGAIAAAAHLCTPVFVEMTAAALAGDRARAVELATALLPLVGVGFSEPNPAAQGGLPDGVRSPERCGADDPRRGRHRRPHRRPADQVTRRFTRVRRPRNRGRRPEPGVTSPPTSRSLTGP